MPPTASATAIKKSGSSTATTTSTAICRSIASSVLGRCGRNCARAIVMPAMAPSKHLKSSFLSSANASPSCASSRGPTAGSSASRSSPRANSTECFMSPAWRRTRPCCATSMRRCSGPRPTLACAADGASYFCEFEYLTATSWSRARQVITKTQVNPNGENPRFLVTNLPADHALWEPERLYREFHRARGDAENRIKERQLDLFDDRMSCEAMSANQRAAHRTARDGTQRGHDPCQSLARDHPPASAQNRGSGHREHPACSGALEQKLPPPVGSVGMLAEVAGLTRVNRPCAHPEESPKAPRTRA